MFSELPRFFESSRQLRTVIDIGCGFGVPACWLIENFAELNIYGLDPDNNRVRIASRALGPRGPGTGCTANSTSGRCRCNAGHAALFK